MLLSQFQCSDADLTMCFKKFLRKFNENQGLFYPPNNIYLHCKMYLNEIH